MNKPSRNPKIDALRERLRRLGLYGLLAHAEEIVDEEWLERVLEIEDTERQRRSLERRLRTACIGSFKPIADFDWAWPTKLDRELVDELFNYPFMQEAANVILVGPNGVGKTLIAKNLAYQAVLKGYTSVYFRKFI